MKVKSPLANVKGVSSVVLTVLMLATGTSLTGVTSIFIVAATVPLPLSLTGKSKVANGEPFWLAGGV